MGVRLKDDIGKALSRGGRQTVAWGLIPRASGTEVFANSPVGTAEQGVSLLWRTPTIP